MTKKYTVRIPPDVETSIRHLHPQIKSKIRRALEAIEKNPHLGKPLRKPLAGLHTYRTSQYRIVYEVKQCELRIEIIDIAERKIIYQRVAKILGRFH